MTTVDPTACPLSDWIHHQAEAFPHRPALTFAGRTLDYAAFADRSRRLARGLAGALDLKRGDRVAHLGKSHPDLLVLLFAAARLGMTVVPLNWRLAPPEREAIIEDAGPEAIVCEVGFETGTETPPGDPWPRRPASLRIARGGWHDLDDILQENGPDDLVGQGGDPLLIVYTSGTTGVAKGAVLTQDAVRWNAANSVDMHDLNAEDRILTALPLFHVGGLNIQTLPGLAVGAEVLLEARFDPAATLAQIAQAKPTQVVLVPAMMKALIDHPDFAAADLSSLRQITTGSSIVPIPLIQAFHDRGVRVTQVYGTTETAPIAVYQRADDALGTVGSAGRTAKHGDMRIVGEDGAATPPGVAGEIQIRGPQVMACYWNNPSATGEAFVDGWFRTGDIGRLDEEGNLYVEARADDLIKSGGERIYPAEIEDILREVDGVDEVIVVGRADPTWGEVPVAVVRPADGARLEAEQLLQELDGRIARYKWPKEVRFVDELPRSALGKVLRYRLRAEIDPN